MPRTSPGTRRAGHIPAPHTGDPKIDKPMQAVAEQFNRLQQQPLGAAVFVETRLVSGVNKVGHGLGRPVWHFLVGSMPAGVTVTSAQAGNPNPDRSVWVELSGASRADALLILLPVT